ncbi:Leucine-rich repeat-containing protein oda7 [Trebouxia sp. C0009 RCD-2024]
MEMTPSTLRNICKETKLYKTPSLNDKLYLHFKGFQSIAHLEPYTGLKALFLEGNAFESLEGLPPLSELKCLYVQQNILDSLTGLEVLPALDTLNISNNRLCNLENISSATSLQTLVCTYNKLKTGESIAELRHCSSLQTLDLQHNELDDPDVLDLFKELPDLRCLYLSGNPLVSKIKNYRKTVVASLSKLTYLDDRPIFEVERRCAEAWVKGGLEAERAERVKCKQEDMERERRNFEAMQVIRREGFRKRRAALGLPPGDTDPYFDTMDDSEWQPEEEPEELIAARSKLNSASLTQQENEPAGTRPVSSSPSTAEQPLQSVSAASGNIQQEDVPVSTKAGGQPASSRPGADAEKLTASETTAANMNPDAHSEQEAETINTNGLKLFATAGHEVTSFVANEDEDDSNFHDNRQQTVSTTPYDELD